MTKEQAKKYGSEILSIFPDDITIGEVAFLLAELLASTLESQAGFAQQVVKADGFPICPDCGEPLVGGMCSFKCEREFKPPAA